MGLLDWFIQMFISHMIWVREYLVVTETVIVIFPETILSRHVYFYDEEAGTFIQNL